MDTNAKANIYLQIHECKLGDKKSTHIERIKHDIRNCKRLSAEQTTAMLAWLKSKRMNCSWFSMTSSHKCKNCLTVSKSDDKERVWASWCCKWCCWDHKCWHLLHDHNRYHLGTLIVVFVSVLVSSSLLSLAFVPFFWWPFAILYLHIIFQSSILVVLLWFHIIQSGWYEKTISCYCWEHLEPSWEFHHVETNA